MSKTARSKNSPEKLTKLTTPTFNNYSDVDYLPGLKEWENLIGPEELKKIDAELFADEME
ncbi:MAG: hypothetical protein ABW044_11630 [Cellvibrio sp.]